MRSPLTLAIDDGHGEKHVTRRTRGLRFKRKARGGDAGMSCVLDLPRGFFTDLSANDPATLCDARSGRPVFRGLAFQPGRTVTPSGDRFEFQAFGGAARLQALTKPLLHVHALDDGWPRVDSTKGANVDQQQKNDGTPTFEVSWDKSFDLEANDQGQFGNRVFQAAGLKLARVRADWDAGRTSANLAIAIRAGTSIDALTAAASDTATTAGGTLAAWVGGGGITWGDDVAGLRVRWTGSASSVSDRSLWVRFFNVIARQVLKDKYGNDITDAATYSGSDANTVFAHEVIRDMLGRGMCPGLDPDKVTVGTFDYPIDALSWLDGIKMSDALEELAKFEPSLRWQVYGDEANFDAMPAESRYVLDERDGVTLPGDDGASLADRVHVSWTDRRGREQSKTVVVDVDGLDYAQEIEPITLPPGMGSDANATRVGTKAIESHNRPPKAGTAVVRRPLLDLWTGAMVQPWEVMPGCLADLRQSGDQLELTEMEFSDDDSAAVLTLNQPRRTTEQVIADLERQLRRNRR